MIPTKNQGSLQRRSYAENAESRTWEKQNLEWKAINNSTYLQAGYTIKVVLHVGCMTPHTIL